MQPAVAQEVLNNNSPAVRWQKINTPNFRILYQQGFDEQAQRMANTLEHIRQAESRTLGVSTRKISVVLQSQNAISNGFVSLIPRRSEFYTMPPQDYNFTGTTEWLDQLASHEYRHVVQFDKANRGFNKLLYYAFGPATLAAMSVTAVPQWFWEGDAVVTETAFTPGGRGRVPNFGLVFRTNLLEGREFNYHKQYLRSYKHNIPDHYVLGYHMVSYLRRHTNDPMIWDKITSRAWSVPFVPFTFSNAIKKETGMHVTGLYKKMAADLEQEWQTEIEALSLTSFETLPHQPRTGYTDYLYPQVLEDGSLVVMKRGIGDILQFRILKDGLEKRSFIPGVVNGAGMLSAAGNLVVWNEYGFDPRWRMRTYSVIKLYHVKEKRLKIVTRKTRYAGAALSPDQKKIVTVETDTAYNTNLVVLDTAGHVLKKFPNPHQAFYSMPRWSFDGQKIVTLKTTKQGRAISVFDYASGEEVELIAPSQENIGHPVLVGDHLFYNSPVTGLDNIYVLDLKTGQRLQVTNSKYGSYNPVVSPDFKTIYYNEQTRDGMDVVAIPFDPTAWRPYTPKPNPKSFFQVITEQEGRPGLFDSVPQKVYASKPYSKLAGVINPYSWGAYFNTGLTQADIGISSQDILSTTIIKAGYLYDINERTGMWRTGISYQNWFPIIDVDVTFGKRTLDEGPLRYADIVAGDTIVKTENLSFNWNEKNIEGGIRLPLVTTNSRYFGNFTVGNNVGYTQVDHFTNSITGTGRLITPQIPVYWIRTVPGNGDLVYNRFYMSAYRLLKQNRRDINSKWGQAFFLNAYSTPYGGDYSGKQFSFYTTLYFPGLFKHHSLWGYWAYQKTAIELLRRTSANVEFTDNNTYLFRNQIPLPRGVPVSRFKDFYSMSANYTLPIWYPDVALGPLVNFQRVRGNVFCDYGFGSSVFPNRTDSQQYLSVGGEVKVDLNIMRLLNQFNIGFRYSYGLQPSVTRFEFLLGTINF
ncbi:MAG: hypothetical protein KF725_05135 [Cyclobacteriaceae bacterium]|nr:hypothetical protein [Cyclobacteriaceae bacterium]UYN85860.1 MAG: hypothetical protein KIT51_13415 [Cyclobacteriaceae bacterium]